MLSDHSENVPDEFSELGHEQDGGLTGKNLTIKELEFSNVKVNFGS